MKARWISLVGRVDGICQEWLWCRVSAINNTMFVVQSATSPQCQCPLTVERERARSTGRLKRSERLAQHIIATRSASATLTRRRPPLSTDHHPELSAQSGRRQCAECNYGGGRVRPELVTVGLKCAPSQLRGVCHQPTTVVAQSATSLRCQQRSTLEWEYVRGAPRREAKRSECNVQARHMSTTARARRLSPQLECDSVACFCSQCVLSHGQIDYW